MKKGIQAWQFILGVILCGLAIIVAFIPKYSLNSTRITKTCVSFAKSNMGELFLLLDEDAMADLEESIEEKIGDLKEDGVKLTYSNFDIATHSLQRYIYDYCLDSAEKKTTSVNDMMEELYDRASESEAETIKGLITAYNVLRVISILSMLFPIILLILFYFCWFKKVPRWLLIIFSGVWFGIQTLYMVLITTVLPQKVAGKISFDEYGLDASSIAGKLIKSILWCLHGIGYYLEVIIVVLLLVLTILCLIIKVKEKENSLLQQNFADQPVEFGQPGNFEQQNEGFFSSADIRFDDANRQGDMPNIEGVGHTAAFIQANNNAFQQNPFEQNNYTVPLANNMPSQSEMMTETSANQTGKIRVIQGSMKGAEIDMKAGEKIIVGRDPMVSQLILMDIKVSRKHCMIAFNSATGMYHVECYSQNGLIVSDKCNLMMNQCAEVSRGTKIILADGKEIILLV